MPAIDEGDRFVLEAGMDPLDGGLEALDRLVGVPKSGRTLGGLVRFAFGERPAISDHHALHVMEGVSGFIDTGPDREDVLAALELLGDIEVERQRSVERRRDIVITDRQIDVLQEVGDGYLPPRMREEEPTVKHLFDEIQRERARRTGTSTLPVPESPENARN